MPAERVAMRQAREIIRLKFSAAVATREIARRLRVAPSTVRETLKRVESAGLAWPLPEGLSDGDLEAALYANRRGKRGHRRLPEPDWPAIHRELKRKHVTLSILWDEYIEQHPDGYRYSRFCDWRKAPPPVRRRRSPPATAKKAQRCPNDSTSLEPSKARGQDAARSRGSASWVKTSDE